MIPEATKSGLERYANHRIPTGGFLRAVLTNDLVGAVQLADPDNLAALTEIVRLCCDTLPGNCWGSKEKVATYLSHRNL